jgi:hypothetical protein
MPGGFFLWLPAKLAHDGKRRAVYFPNRNAAYNAIMGLKYDLREHGKGAITADERAAITLARRELGDLSKLPEIIRYWKQFGPDAVTKTTLQDAIPKYLEYRATLDLDRRTQSDTKSALHVFSLNRHWQYVHEITTPEVREYMNQRAPGSSRKTAYKHLNLFFRWCKEERLVIVNPLDAIHSPADKAKEVEVYSVEDFEKLLRTANETDSDLVPFLALSGFGMMRSGELIARYGDDPVLQWHNVIWERGLIDVPEAVAKQTRRAVGNRREFPLCDTLRHWLEAFKTRKGRVVDLAEAEFRPRMNKLFAAAGVTSLDNGLRKSAISYYIAAHPADGVTLAARYAGNSESISRRYYLTWLTEEKGQAWFGIRRAQQNSVLN